MMHSVPRWFLAFAVACSDYGIEKQRAVVDGGEGDIVADPGQLVWDALCAADSASIHVDNAGDGNLTLTAISIDGSGWSLGSVAALPLVLKPGESTLIPVTGFDGNAMLVLESDDADTPELSIPLHATANTAPVTMISSPTAAQVWVEGEDVLLDGFVQDEADPPESLSISWASSAVGVLSTAAASVDGTTTYAWPTADRPTGHQTITLTATDSCGATSTATVDVCQDGAFTYDALDVTTWHYEGSAAYDSTEAYLQLTPATQDQVGSAFEIASPVNGDSVDIDFAFYIGDGTGADGLSLTTLDTARMTTFLGGTGCGIGYGGDAACTAGPALPGWSIEVDTYYNGDADPTDADHVAFTFDGDVDAPKAWATLPEMEDSGWHEMQVSVVAPHVSVAIDGTTYIDQDIDGMWAFTGYVGFTAGTGGETNRHLIDSLQVTDYSCD